MQYLCLTFTLTPASEAAYELLADALAGAGFDSFVHTDELDLPRVAFRDNFPESAVFADKAATDSFQAYIPAARFDEAELRAVLADFPLPDVRIDYVREEVEDKNWNEEWEKNYFQPLLIGTPENPRCVVSSTFHTDVPAAPYAIKINPQMSFGTGHHQTTAQMLERLLDDEVRGLEVLDMGCGTGILAILASLRGAKHCVAVDFDEWCVRNTRDNLALNPVGEIEVVHGDATALDHRAESFDLVIANINRNILLADLPRYVAAMRSGAHIYMSGFYTADVPALRERAEALGLTFVDERSREDWACLKFRKA